MKGAIKMSTRTIENPKVVSREEWLAARKQLLAKEKKLTRERDAVAAERRQLPWVKVEKNYVFDSPSGKKTLGELFAGKSQLRLSLHVRSGLARRVPELLVQDGSHGRRIGASCAARRFLCSSFPSAVVKN
jgi:Bacterial protein of unknown function (DUF899)